MNIRRYGPYGNKEGQYWGIGLQRGERFQEVTIRHGSIVDGIYFQVSNPNGETKLHSFGGNGGNLTKLTMQPNEYIIQISGIHGFWTDAKCHVVATITIHTNLKPEGYGPYGAASGMTDIKSFASPVLQNYGAVIDFFGLQGDGFLRSIGVGISVDAE